MDKLEKLLSLKKQLHAMIKSAYNDPNADSEEIDKYLDMINQINKLLEIANKDISDESN